MSNIALSIYYTTITKEVLDRIARGFRANLKVTKSY